MHKNGKITFSLDDAGSSTTTVPSDVSDEEDFDINSLPHSNPFPSQVLMSPHSRADLAWKRTLASHSDNHETFLDKIDLAASAVINGAGFLATGSMPPAFSLLPSDLAASSSRSSSNISQRKKVAVEESPRPSTAPEKVPSLEINSDSLDTLLEDILQNSNTHSLNDLVASTENPHELWRKGVDGKTNRIDTRRKIFGSFNRTGGEPPKTPPHIPFDELSPDKQAFQNNKSLKSKSQPHLITQKKKKSSKTMANTDDMLFGAQRHSGSENYSNITPKVDTGLSQIKKEVKLGHDGVPIPNKTHHPLTLGSRLTPKSFDYSNARAKRQQRIAEATERLHNNSGSRIKDLRHFYIPQNLQQQQLQQQNLRQGVNTIVAGRAGQQQRHQLEVARQMEMYKQRQNAFSSTLMANVPNINMGQKAYPARGGVGLGLRGLDLDRPSLYNGPAPSRYGQDPSRTNYNISITGALSYGYPSMRHNGSWGQPGRQGLQPFQRPQQSSNTSTTATTGAGKKIYRPSQLLPIHIPRPGPKHGNIYIGPYSESKPTPEATGPMKSRKR